MMAIISCGPSAEEKAAAEKKIQDSVEAARIQMQAARDAARQQFVEDSMAVTDTTIVAPAK